VNRNRGSNHDDHFLEEEQPQRGPTKEGSKEGGKLGTLTFPRAQVSKIDDGQLLWQIPSRSFWVFTHLFMLRPSAIVVVVAESQRKMRRPLNPFNISKSYKQYI
jgi:hypothetical protein